MFSPLPVLPRSALLLLEKNAETKTKEALEKEGVLINGMANPFSLWKALIPAREGMTMHRSSIGEENLPERGFERVDLWEAANLLQAIESDPLWRFLGRSRWRSKRSGEVLARLRSLAEEFAAAGAPSTERWKRLGALRMAAEKLLCSTSFRTYALFRKTLFWERDRCRKGPVRCLRDALQKTERLLGSETLAEEIALPPRSSSPDLSLVILGTEGNGILRTLQSISEHPPENTSEIIFSVAHRSVQESGLEQIEHLQILCAHGSRWQVQANVAAERTQGQLLLFLKEGTILLPGAIDALVATARREEDVGLVGGKLVAGSGELLSAGGIVWRDGSPMQVGSGEDPERPSFCYVREVDYLSSDLILFSRIDWIRMGGFDPALSGAYAVADLSFRLRADGRRVLYQPAAVAIRPGGEKEEARQGRRQFRKRWRDLLDANQYRKGKSTIRAWDRSKGRRILLVIDHYVPEPDRDAGSRSMVDLIRNFQLDGWLIKFWPDDRRFDPVYTPRLQQMGIETMACPWENSFEAWLKARRDNLDAVFLSRPNVAHKYLRAIRSIAPHLPVLYYGHDLHAARLRRQFAVTRDPALLREADAMEAWERLAWRAADLVLYPSQEEADEVKRMVSGVDTRSLVPFSFDEFRSLRVPPRSTAILFVGGFSYPPNVDAARWLVEEIFPLVEREVPETRLWLVGSKPLPEVQSLAGEQVDVTGWVSEDELARRYAAARVAVVPLRFGAGVKLKVVEALREGLPIVTTPTGAQGLEGIERVAPVAEDAEALARAIVSLLQDDAQWQEQARKQLEYARNRFSREASRRSLAEAVETAFANAARRNGRSERSR